MSETPKKKCFAYQWRFSSELNTSRQHNGPSCSLTMRFPPKRRNKPVLRAFFMGKKEVYSKKCREKVKIKYKWRLFFTNMTLPDNLSPENQQLSPQISQTLFWAWDKGAGLRRSWLDLAKCLDRCLPVLAPLPSVRGGFGACR